MTANPFAALLRGVTIWIPDYDGLSAPAEIQGMDHGWVKKGEVLAALAAAVPADLAEAGKVLEGVTGNAWRIHRIASLNVETTDGRSIASCAGYSDNRRMAEVNEENAANARFIAWCREGVPALLARIAAQEAQINGLMNGTGAASQMALDYMARAEAAETALAAERAKTAKLVEAGKALQTDMLERARIGRDAIHGEEYRIVNAGRTAWADFCAAITEAQQ